MSYILPNARISTLRNGTSIYTNRVVQLDDGKSTAEGDFFGVPIQSKVIYDLPAANYKRGDRVLITMVGGHGVAIPDDHIFWVRRALEAGSPLEATEVGIVGGIPTTETLKIFRPSTQAITLASARAYYVLSGPERFQTIGGSLAGTLYFPDTTLDIRMKDIVIFTQGDDLTTEDDQVQYNILSALHSPAPVPHLRVDIATSIGGYQALLG